MASKKKNTKKWTQEVLNELTVAELVALYNRLTGKKVKRIASKALAVKRVLAAQMTVPKPEKAPKKDAAPKVRIPARGAKKSPKKVDGLPLPHRREKGEKRRKRLPVPKGYDPFLAQRTRNRVKADGVEYRSTYKAFQELGLDEKKCEKFRKDLKMVGKLTFEGVKFEVVYDSK